MRRLSLIALALGALLPQLALAGPGPIEARGRQLRIDVLWQGQGHMGDVHQVRHSQKAEGPYEIHGETLLFPIYSHYIGEAGATRYYQIRSGRIERGTFHPSSEWSGLVHATTLEKNPAGLIDEMQEAAVRLATIGNHPISGLTGEWIRTRGQPKPGASRVGATGATGMGLANLVVAAERSYLPREDAAAAVLKALRFLDSKAERFHGAYSHWIHNHTGEALPFSKYDNGGDIVETALLAQGILIAREYFDATTPTETELRETANRIWHSIDWDWYRNGANDHLLWHWSPDYGWKMQLPVRGFNESEITYLLGIASPTHPIPVNCYYQGWRGKHFGSDRQHFGIDLQLGHGMGGCAFWYYYSHLGIDPREMRYRGRTYHQHYTDLCRVQVAYMRSQADRFSGYDTMWGITAAPGPDGYAGFKPGRLDNGTLVPAASLSAYTYAPTTSQQALETMYYEYGDRLWSDFGFIQSFNLSRDWSFPLYLGIDGGTVAPMLENHRTGLLWRLFMNAPEIQQAIHKLQSDPRWSQ